MDFESTESAAQAPAGLVPWFDAGQTHGRHHDGLDTGSTLGFLNRPHVLGAGHRLRVRRLPQRRAFGNTLTERVDSSALRAGPGAGQLTIAR